MLLTFFIVFFIFTFYLFFSKEAKKHSDEIKYLFGRLEDVGWVVIMIKAFRDLLIAIIFILIIVLLF
jgi:hypothetical protein